MLISLGCREAKVIFFDCQKIYRSDPPYANMLSAPPTDTVPYDVVATFIIVRHLVAYLKGSLSSSGNRVD